MESFIVRIYRRNRTKPEEIAGLVETVGTDEKSAFQSFAGLVTAIKKAIFQRDAGPVTGLDRAAYPASDKKQAG